MAKCLSILPEDVSTVIMVLLHELFFSKTLSNNISLHNTLDNTSFPFLRVISHSALFLIADVTLSRSLWILLPKVNYLPTYKTV